MRYRKISKPVQNKELALHCFYSPLKSTTWIWILPPFGSKFLVVTSWLFLIFDPTSYPAGLYCMYAKKGIVDSVVACSPLNAKALHATFKSLVLKTRSRYISLLDLGWSFEIKRTVFEISPSSLLPSGPVYRPVIWHDSTEIVRVQQTTHMVTSLTGVRSKLLQT